MTSEYTWNGSGLKFAVTMTCEGFDMDTDDWIITVAKEDRSVAFTPETAVRDDQGQWYICVDSGLLGPGLARIIFDAFVPDEDFEDGIRHEIQVFDLVNIKVI